MALTRPAPPAQTTNETDRSPAQPANTRLAGGLAATFMRVGGLGSGQPDADR
ncbi:MAG: hypothetical protein ACI9BK_003121, partial [Acidimicrobiales bacterium]